MILNLSIWRKQFITGVWIERVGQGNCLNLNSYPMRTNKAKVLTNEAIINKIYIIRGQKVMIDMDLAYLYKVETKRLKESVKRNLKRFPKDFMFRLTKKEFENLRSQIATSSWGGQ